MSRRKLLVFVLLLVALIAWMAQSKPGPSKAPQIDSPSQSGLEAQDGSEFSAIVNPEGGEVLTRVEAPAHTEESHKTTIGLVSSVGVKIERVVLHKQNGERRFFTLPRPGEIERALVPVGTVIAPSGHLSQKVEESSSELVFSPYALLRIQECPPEISVSDITCQYIHDEGMGRFYVWAEKVDDEIVIVAMPPSELEEASNILALPLKLRLTGGYSLEVDFTKQPGVVGECPWGAILFANPSGPPMRIQAVGEGFHNVEWQRFFWLSESQKLRKTVTRGPWGAIRISAMRAMDVLASGKEVIFTDIPLGAEVLFLGTAEEGLVGWSPVVQNSGQEVEVLLGAPMQVVLRLQDPESLEGVSAKPYFIKMWFTYREAELRRGKQKAVQEFRGMVGSDGIVQFLPNLNPQALFSWLRPDVISHGLPDELRVHIFIPGYSMVEIVEPISDFSPIDLGVIELEQGGDSVELEMGGSITPIFVAGSYGLGVDLEPGQHFPVQSAPGFEVEVAEPLTSSSFRLWLSGRGATAEASPFLILDTEQSSTGFIRSTISNKYMPLKELEYQVEIGPETRAAFEGSRLALAFGNSALLTFPFSETVQYDSPCTLNFRAPASHQYLVFLPLLRGGLAQCFALSPGWTYFP